MATLLIPLDPKVADIFGTANIPEFVSLNGTNGPVSGYAFDAGTMEQLFYRVPAADYLSGNVSITIRWVSRTPVTSNAVVWGSQLFAITPGDAQSVLTKAFGTAATTTTTVNSTASGETETVVVITSLDSLAAGDDMGIRIYRDAAAGGDTMTGDAIIIEAFASYAANSGGGSGDVTGPAGATDNAIVRFDATTGKVVQDSPVTIADTTGNIAGAGTYNGVTVDKHALVASTTTTQALTTVTTMQSLTNLSLSLPRAGSYWIEGMIETTATATLTCSFGMNISANFTRMSVGWTNPLTTSTFASGQQTASIASGAAAPGIASGSRTGTGAIAVVFSGLVVVSGAATVQLLASRSTSTLTIGAASAFNVREQ